MTVIARQNTKRLCNRTHSWTVHSGIVFGIWPLLSRLQSTSSPEHAQGGGHVPAWAPHPRCSLRESRKITANPANPRGCGEDRILNLSRERERTPLFGRIFEMKRHQFHRARREVTTHTHTHTKKIPNLLPLTAAADAYIQSVAVVRAAGEKGDRKALFSNSPIPVEKLFVPSPSPSPPLLLLLGQTCAVQDPHSAAWAHSRGMRGGRGHKGGAWVM